MQTGMRGAAWSLLALCSAACADASSTATSEALDLRSFVLESSERTELLNDVPVALAFVGSEVRFHATCKHSTAQYALADGSLQLRELETALAKCAPDPEAQDDWLRAFMTTSPSISLSATRLTLRNADATLVFIDREVAQPEAKLANRTFALGFHMLPGEPFDAEQNDAFVVFAPHGELHFDTSCNSGTGSYQVSERVITFSELSLSDSVCAGGRAATQADVLAVIANGTVGYTLEGRQLILVHGDKLLQGVGD